MPVPVTFAAKCVDPKVFVMSPTLVHCMGRNILWLRHSTCKTYTWSALHTVLWRGRWTGWWSQACKARGQPKSEITKINFY